MNTDTTSPDTRHAHPLGEVDAAISNVDARITALTARVTALESGIVIPPVDPPPGPEPSTDPPGILWCPASFMDGTDQSAALRSWIGANAAPGKPLGIRKGTVRVDPRCQINTSHVWLWGGQEATIRRVSETAVYPIIEFKACADIRVEGLNVRGPDGARAYNDQAGFDRQDEHAIALVAVKRATLRDLYLTNLYGDGVYWTRSDSMGASSIPEDITLDQVHVTAAGRNGFSHIGGRRITAIDCSADTTKLHGWDVEGNKADDVTEDVTLTRFRSRNTDMGQTSSGPGYAIAIGAGYAEIAANRVTITGLDLDRAGRAGRAAVYVVGPSASKPHRNVTLTGTRCLVPSTADIRNANVTASDNDGLTW